MANLTATQHEGLVQLAGDMYKGKETANFSAKKKSETLYEGIIAANGGKNYLDIRDVLNGDCREVFRLVEDIVEISVSEGLKGNEFFMRMVEESSIDEGDDKRFWVPDNSFYIVSEMARGNASINRQRIKSGSYQYIYPTMKGIRVWEHMERLLSKRVEMTDMLDGLNRAMTKKKLDDIYSAFQGIPLDSDAYRPAAGTYDETKLREVIAHLEAETGEVVTIMGTKLALSQLDVVLPDKRSDLAKNDLYNMGYYGNFYGTECVEIKQYHKTNSTDFGFDDKTVYLFAGDTKPIKVVTKGSPLIVPKHAITDTADFTEEYFLGMNYGVGVIISDQFGIYSFT